MIRVSRLYGSSSFIPIDEASIVSWLCIKKSSSNGRGKLNSPNSDFLTSKATFAELSKIQRTKADARFIDGNTVNDRLAEKNDMD